MPARRIDPVCGMEVDPGTPWKTVYKGRVYHFCSQQCLRAFKERPTTIWSTGPRGCRPGATAASSRQGVHGMVMRVELRDETLYACSLCGAIYEEAGLARECEEACSTVVTEKAVGWIRRPLQRLG